MINLKPRYWRQEPRYWQEIGPCGGALAGLRPACCDVITLWRARRPPRLGGCSGGGLPRLSGCLAGGVRGKRDLAAQVEAWLQGHAAAAGSGGFCWRSQECSAPSPSRVLCCQPCLTFAEKQAWKEVARRPPLSTGPGRLARRERHRSLLVSSGAAGATLERHLALWPGDTGGPPGLLRPATLEGCLACFARRHWRAAWLASPGELQGPAVPRRTD